ncbi:MAG: PQQ-like beta-propeller repeat protein [Gemmataceae bacterium]|nr:PQQ-like beta-propeller repeat protein [Gemmataceae bacterium]
MTTTSQAPPTRACCSLRAWFPVLALALGVGANLLIWSLASEETAPIYLRLYTYAASGLTVLVLLLWLLFFAPFRRALRYQILAVVLVLFGGWVASIDFKRSRFDTSLGFHPVYRWEAAPSWSSAQGKVEGNFSGQLPDDSPEFRGRRRDGVIVGPALARDWSATPPRQLWRQPAGVGHSSFAIADGIAVTMEQREDDEAVVCYDLATGRQLWVYSYPALFENFVGGNGPRSTPTIADGEVYALGATGKLLCLDAQTGTRKWEADLLENNVNITWGLSGSPLVFDNLVVVNPGVQSPSAPGTLTAHDRKTGKRVWAGGRAHAGYSSPMLATLGGKRQILLFDGEGLAGYDPKAGKELWRHPWPTQENINACQPLLLGEDRVFISSGYDVGSARLHIKEQGGRWKVEEEWRTPRLRCRFSSPVLHEGHIYGLDEEVLVCLDARTGKRQWRGGRYGNGQLLLVNGLLLIVTEKTGELVLVEPTPEAHRELTRFRVLGESSITWNVPALSGGRLLVRNSEEMACYDLRAPKP